jgi:hypothetical protein
MSTDIVDDLHAAEDRIGVLETLLETIHGFARDHPWTGLGDAHSYPGYETLLADISMRTADRYERPSCGEDCDDEFCGSPRHYDQEFNEATREWEGGS